MRWRKAGFTRPGYAARAASATVGRRGWRKRMRSCAAPSISSIPPVALEPACGGRVAVGVEGAADVGDNVGGQGVEREPGQLVALVRLGVGDGAGPAHGGEEEVYALTVVGAA